MSNGGAVSGYSFQTGPYSIWFPDSNNIVTEIGGVAPGSGVAGQARFSEDGNILCGTNLGNAGAEMALFNRTTNNWTNLGSLGYQVDGNVSGGFAISGDGKRLLVFLGLILRATWHLLMQSPGIMMKRSWTLEPCFWKKHQGECYKR